MGSRLQALSGACPHRHQLVRFCDAKVWSSPSPKFARFTRASVTQHVCFIVELFSLFWCAFLNAKVCYEQPKKTPGVTWGQRTRITPGVISGKLITWIRRQKDETPSRFKLSGFLWRWMGKLKSIQRPLKPFYATSQPQGARRGFNAFSAALMAPSSYSGKPSQSCTQRLRLRRGDGWHEGHELSLCMAPVMPCIPHDRRPTDG